MTIPLSARCWVIAMILAPTLSGLFAPPHTVKAANSPLAVDGAFARYWANQGGLARFGVALTAAIVDPESGQIVQYFERARFEYHPENLAALVQLTPLGLAATASQPERFAPPLPCSAECSLFPATNHTVRGRFAQYWAKGGITAFGQPLTEELSVVSPVDGQEYVVQWFEFARFEYHPAYAGTPSEVLLGHLGREALVDHPELVESPTVPVPVGPRVIVLDPGHDPSTGGAIGLEQGDTLRFAQMLAALLTKHGYIVRLTRPTETTILFDQPTLLLGAGADDSGYREGYAHASKILELQPDLAISIHYNAAASGPGGGSTTFYCAAGGPQNEYLASLLQTEIAGAMQWYGYTPPASFIAEDGVIGKGYGHLATLGNLQSQSGAAMGNRMGGFPVVLTEALFETNPHERALIVDEVFLARLAEGYLWAIDTYFATIK